MTRLYLSSEDDVTVHFSRRPFALLIPPRGVDHLPLDEASRTSSLVATKSIAVRSELSWIFLRTGGFPLTGLRPSHVGGPYFIWSLSAAFRQRDSPATTSRSFLQARSPGR